MPIDQHNLPEKLQLFVDTIWSYYALNKRTFPWRDIDDPYHVVVSEIMLQQTQTYRVIPKYEAFVSQFPTFESLAQAPLRDLLVAWQGLGYNRRALALQATAQRIVKEFGGVLPDDPAILETFPGIGPATAGSICAFAFNNPTIFIETNIRTVYIHFFAPQQTEIKDSYLLPLIQETVAQENPRQWYYALMDYGVMLKSTRENPSRKSAHHSKQSRFEGSDRQIRGMILKLLTLHHSLEISALYAAIDRPSERISKALHQLINEKFLISENDKINIV